MSDPRDSESSFDQDLVIRSIDHETQALLDSVLGGFLEIDLQFEPVVEEFTGGNVITHLSREADRMADELFEATERPVPPIDPERQYDLDPGGMRPAAVLIEDFVESSTRLQEAMAGVHDLSLLQDGVRDLPSRRLVQLVVHHADLTRSWDAVSDEVAAAAASQLTTVMAAELSNTRFVIQSDQALVSSSSGDGETIVAGDARTLLAWASGRMDGADSSRAVVRSAPVPRVWF